MSTVCCLSFVYFILCYSPSKREKINSNFYMLEMRLHSFIDSMNQNDDGTKITGSVGSHSHFNLTLYRSTKSFHSIAMSRMEINCDKFEWTFRFVYSFLACATDTRTSSSVSSMTDDILLCLEPVYHCVGFAGFLLLFIEIVVAQFDLVTTYLFNSFVWMSMRKISVSRRLCHSLSFSLWYEISLDFSQNPWQQSRIKISKRAKKLIEFLFHFCVVCCSVCGANFVLVFSLFVVVVVVSLTLWVAAELHFTNWLENCV